MTPPDPVRQGRGAAAPHRLVETGFGSMPGFADGDHREALQVFRRSARAIVDDRPPLRSAQAAGDALRTLCRQALDWPAPASAAEARRLLEGHFAPHDIEPRDGTPGFLTGYYEPEIEGTMERCAEFVAPILRRPPHLPRIGPGVAEHPWLDRASIEARIGTADCQPILWLRDWVEVFLVHVQGSARIRLPDGRRLRLVYDGRNGQPYTSVGRILVARGELAAEAMSLDRLKRWIRDQGQALGEPGRDLMQTNRSYIFFRAEPDRPDEGPIGGGGLPLAPLRSIAVDRGVWPYGLPFFIVADLPWRSAAPIPFQRLMIAQDTGSAILGPARADIFFGSGDEAGRRAGDIRHPGRFTVLLPRPAGRVA